MGEGAQSHHGYVATLWLVPIAWAARQQTVVACLTCHAEFIALLAASVEGVWLADILGSLIGRVQLLLFCDNLETVKIATNKASVIKVKNINREFHYVNELLRKGTMALKWVAGKDQLADVFTKALGPNLLDQFTGAVFR
jgi:L-lactate permease